MSGDLILRRGVYDESAVADRAFAFTHMLRLRFLVSDKYDSLAVSEGAVDRRFLGLLDRERAKVAAPALVDPEQLPAPTSRGRICKEGTA